MIAAFSLALAAAQPARYANPILFADYSDPDVIRVGRRFIMVASSFHFSPGLPVLESGDLVHWRLVGHVLPRLPFAPGYDMVPPFTLTDATSKPVGPGQRYAGGVWAPAIRVHAGRLFVYWPTPDEGIFMASATHPEGPWSAPVRVIAGAGYEDPCPFWDDDGSAWLIHGKVGAGPLVLHRMSADGTRVLDAGQTVVDDPAHLPVLEGPKLLKRNGWYYIWAPFGGVETGAQAVLRARTITGPFEHRVVLAQGATVVRGPHQGGYVETPTGQGWFVHFNSTGAFGRITYLEPVRWQDDWPVVGDAVAGEPGTGQPVASHAAPDVPPAPAAIPTSDAFARRTLGLQWEWNHNPVAGGWSLSERPGWLRLHALPARHLVTARDTLTQMLWGPASRVTARFDLAGLAEGQRAGLAMFQARPVWIGAVREGGATHLALSVAGAEQAGPALPPGADVQLRVEVSADQLARFGYSLDGGRSFAAFGGAQPLRFAWWKGARPALFSYTTAERAAGHADVDWVRVEPR